MPSEVEEWIEVVRNPTKYTLREFLDAEEAHCRYKIQTMGDTCTVGRCAQSRMNLIEKVRAVLDAEGSI